MKKQIFLLLFLLTASVSKAQTPTWAEDVAEIFYANCTSCHHPGGIAPFSLLDYGNAIAYAGYIEDEVTARTMPPWPPDPNYRHLAHERVLTQDEINTIADWANNGAPQGNPANAPVPPVYSGNALITNPDLVYQIPTYTVNAGSDLYRNFVVPSSTLNDLYITGFEVLPGNRSIVHHVIVYEDTSLVPLQLDSADPGPGYTNFGGTGSNASNMIGFWVPGMSVFSWPQGMGQKLPAGSNVILQVHYPGGTFNETDSTKIHLTTSSASLRDVFTVPVLNHSNTITNGPLFIPANTTPTFYAQFTTPVFLPLSFISVGVHMHLLGKTAISYGVTPVADTIPFIKINDWDFHWQGLYQFQQILKIPGGTTLYSEMLYDNTAANPHNPNNPPQDVSVGEATTDEMMLVYFSFAAYQQGDENIIIDSSIITGIHDEAFDPLIKTIQLYDPSPNPAKQMLTLPYYLPLNGTVRFNIYSLTGQLLQSVSAVRSRGLNLHQLPVSDLASGSYVVELQVNSMKRSKRFVKE